MIFFILFQIILGWYFGLFAEWFIHKYILHNYGIKRKSIWSFHFKEHHAICRRNQNKDHGYMESKLKWNRISKEILSLFCLAIIHIPLFFILPWFTLVIWGSMLQYYFLHKKSHIDTEWCKKNLPWHYEHHMGKNQHKNYGIRSDLFDRLFGTRKHYLANSENQ